MKIQLQIPIANIMFKINIEDKHANEKFKI